MFGETMPLAATAFTGLPVRAITTFDTAGHPSSTVMVAPSRRLSTHRVHCDGTSSRSSHRLVDDPRAALKAAPASVN